MQVTHTSDHVTHAVISKSAAIDFGISDSPEFFHILSSTLYSDQILAVVRETLCNAWDAHIDAKAEDQFVEINLDDEYLTIRDFGLGISPDMMGPIYGIYGGSTKAKDGKVTGGFGLGCKAPFAYVDDFEVTSWNQGKKTIYRLSKSNAEVGGKPSIIPVVTLPSDETGLQVKISIKNVNDGKRFRELIRRIVQNGGMKMKLNGEELKTLPFNDMVHGYMITSTKLLETMTSIAIRYGNVIYPLEIEDSFKHEWEQIIQFLHSIEGRGGRNWQHGRPNHTLVLQAAPNTISVTPSRESLSMQKLTLATVKSLMQTFLSVNNKKLEAECFKLLDESLAKTFIADTPETLLTNIKSIPNLVRYQRTGYGIKTGSVDDVDKYDIHHMMTAQSYSRMYAHNQYPSFKGFQEKDVLKRLDLVINSGFGGKRTRGLAQTFRTEYVKSIKHPRKVHTIVDPKNYCSYETSPSTWFHRYVAKPIIMKMMEPESGVLVKNLYVYYQGDRYTSNHNKIKSIKSWQPESHLSLLPFVRDIVILSFNRVAVGEGDAENHRAIKYWHGTSANSLLYVVPRSEEKLKQARKFFKDLGVQLVDLTPRQKAEHEHRVKHEVKHNIIKKPKKKGIPVLSTMTTAAGNYNPQMAVLNPDKVQYTLTPEFTLKDSRRNEFTNIDGLADLASRQILTLWGDKGGLVVNQNQEDRYRALGAVDIKDYVLAKLLEEFQTNANIIEFLPLDPTRMFTSSWGCKYKAQSEWVSAIQADPDLVDYFGLIDNRTPRDKMIMSVWRHVDGAYWRNSAANLRTREDILALLKTYKVKAPVMKLFSALQNAPLTSILSAGEIRMKLKSPDTPKVQRDFLRDTLLSCIEGY